MGGDVIDKVGDQRLERDGIAKNGEYVEKIDTLFNGSILENQSHERGRTGLGKSGYLVTILCKRSMSDMADSGLGEGGDDDPWVCKCEREEKN